MKFLLCLSLFVVSAMYACAQSCSSTSPCAQVAVTNSFMASNPGTVNIYKCMGSPTSCSASALATFIASGGASPWAAITPFAQTTATAKYNDPEPSGSLMNYAASNTTTGGTGPVSGITVFPVPAAVPSSPTLSAVLATTGTVGPQ